MTRRHGGVSVEDEPVHVAIERLRGERRAVFRREPLRWSTWTAV